MGFRARQLRPAVRPSNLVLASACMWSGIGILLLGKGCYRLRLHPEFALIIVPVALLAGTLKSRWLLDGAARHAMERLSRYSQATCLGAVYSWKTWILVLCMMALGGILQRSSFPPQLLTFFSFTIGWALLYSSRIAWRAWRQGLGA